MSKREIPESWANCKVGDVFELRNGYAFKSDEFRKAGIKVIRISNIQSSHVDLNDAVCVKDDEAFKKFTVKQHDLLIAMSGATTGKMGIYNLTDPAYQNQRVGNILLKHPGTVVEKYRNYYFMHIQTEILKQAYGGAQPNISGAMIEAFSFPLAPVLEQKRIVEKIESTQEKVKSIETSILKADELIEKYREALLQKAFRGELVPQDPEDEPASNLIEQIRAEKEKQSDGKKNKKDQLLPIASEEVPFEIPKSWEWVTLGDICDLITDGTHQTPTYSNEGVIFLSSKNVTKEIIDWDNVKYIPKKLHIELSKRVQPKVNDILLAKNGTTGVAAIVDREEIFDIYVSLALLRVYSKYIDPLYVLKFINSPVAKTQFNKKLKGVGVPNLHLSEIRKVLIPIPPLREQVKLRTMIDHKIDLIKKKRSEIGSINQLVTTLKKSILSSAFSGQLVPQDSVEGTGHELLAKIKSDQSQIAEPKAIKKDSASGKKKRAKK